MFILLTLIAYDGMRAANQNLSTPEGKLQSMDSEQDIVEASSSESCPLLTWSKLALLTVSGVAVAATVAAFVMTVISGASNHFDTSYFFLVPAFAVAAIPSIGLFLVFAKAAPKTPQRDWAFCISAAPIALPAILQFVGDLRGNGGDLPGLGKAIGPPIVLGYLASYFFLQVSIRQLLRHAHQSGSVETTG